MIWILLLYAVNAILHTDKLVIYDATSTTRPYDISQRGIITFSVDLKNATFEVSDSLSDRIDRSKTPSIYRIGTEIIFGSLLDPIKHLDKIQQGGKSAQEVITLYLDRNDELYHISYEIKSTALATSPKVIMNSMKDHTNKAQVTLKTPAGKKTAKLNTEFGSKENTEGVELVEDDIVIEEEVNQKTFFQKYWIYLIPLAVVLLIGGPGPDEKE